MRVFCTFFAPQSHNHLNIRHISVIRFYEFFLTNTFAAGFFSQ